MEVYGSEQEQLEAIKKWWRDNGPAVVLGVVLGLGALFGWQTWEKHRNKQAELASAIYSSLIVDLDENKFDTINASVVELQNDYSGTPYAALAALAGAKAAVLLDDVDTAKSHLLWAIRNGKQAEIVAIAKLRLALLHLTAGELDAAERLLNEKYPAAFDATYNELLGDLRLAKNDRKGARAAFDLALNASVAAENSQVVQIKRDALGEDDSQNEVINLEISPEGVPSVESSSVIIENTPE